jgi:D-threonate/D-erythronate kinase
MALTIVADDLTGGCDTGTLFAGKEPVPITVWPGISADGAVRVIDTETRAAPPSVARERVAAAARAGSAGRYFKKIDSTLRGPLAAEIDALMTEIGAASALVCPAFPAEGRTVRDRELLVHGVPLARTPPGREAGRRTSDVVALLRAEIDRPLAWIPIADVRAGTGALSARLGRLASTVVVADAETDADLETIVSAALAADPPPVLAGAAGLARALARHLGLLAEDVPMPAARRWLFVAGSRHPATRRQVAGARRAGFTVISAPEMDEPDALAVAARLAGEAKELIETEAFDIVVVTGGDTAVALYHALEATCIELHGAPRPGLALGLIRWRASTLRPRPPVARSRPGGARTHLGEPRAARGLWLVTKAGGFGDPELLASLAGRSA